MNKYLILSCLLCSPVLAFHDPFFDELQESIEEMKVMTHNLSKHAQELAATSSHPKNNISIDQKSFPEKVLIAIDGIETTDIQAYLNSTKDVLTINTDNAKIQLSFLKQMLNITMNHEIKEEINSNGHLLISHGSSKTKTSHSLDSIISLEKPTISYEKKNNQLTIELPTSKKEKARMSIPIEIKE